MVVSGSFCVYDHRVLRIDPWDDGAVPWWSLFAIRRDELDDDERRARARMWQGQDGAFRTDDMRQPRYRAAWERVVAKLEREHNLDMAWWIRNRPQLMRHAALTCPRAFCQLTRLTDDRGRPLVLAGFQVRGVFDMRQREQWLGLWPFEHGKSYLASVLVPLIDWAEDPNCTQIRLYYADAYKLKYARRLMWMIDGGCRGITELFPWVRRPMSEREKDNARPVFDPAPYRDDPGCGWWSTDAFSVGGSTQPEASWRGLTANSGQTGWRAWRVVADDLVNAKNAGSEKVQDYLEEFVNTGAQTMPTQEPPPPTAYSTRYGTFALIGTLFHPNDIGSRLYNRWLNDPKAKVTRLDIFPRGPEEDENGHIEVLWPAKKPLEKVLEMRQRLTADGFDMRCRNLPSSGHGMRTFARANIERAKADLPYGTAPPGARLMIGMDPAKGKRTKWAKNPALFLIGVDPQTGLHHYIRWERLRGLNQLDQTRMMVAWAREYRCPIAIESNYDIEVYEEHIKTVDPGGTVRLITHVTGENKRDPIDGVSRLISLFERKQVRIHGTNCPPDAWTALLTELTEWPNGMLSDLVMALWIVEYQLSLHTQPVEKASPPVLPAYVTARGLGGYIDLRPYQRRHG
jgi:hypothetical protein